MHSTLSFFFYLYTVARRRVHGLLAGLGKSVRERRECTKSEQLMMLLSAETRLGIEITGMQHSTIHTCILQCACFLVTI